jgi:hypothetical protein
MMRRYRTARVPFVSHYLCGNSCNPFHVCGTLAYEAAFIGHQKKEMTMDNSNGAPGASTTPAETARRLKDAASTVVDRGREAAMAKVQDTVHQGAERARTSAQSTSGALRRAADDLQDDNAWIGTGLRRAADYLEQASGQIGQGDFNQVVDGLNNFARRNPALFLGASLAAGFLIARLGKTAIEGDVEAQQGRPDGAYTTGYPPGVTPG